MSTVAWILYCLGSPSTVGIAVFSVATVVVPPEVGGNVDGNVPPGVDGNVPPGVDGYVPPGEGGYVSSGTNGVGDGVVSSRVSIGGGQLSSSKQKSPSDAIMQHSSLDMNSSSPTAPQSRTQVPMMSFHGDSSHTHSTVSTTSGGSGTFSAFGEQVVGVDAFPDLPEPEPSLFPDLPEPEPLSSL